LQEKLSAKSRKRSLRKDDSFVLKSKRTRIRSELLTFMKEMEKKAEDREAQKLDLIKQQHEDWKSFMEKIVTAIIYFFF
jgi:Tfp pilus assembly protein PilE